MEDSRTAYSRLVAHFRKAGVFHSCLELLGWDERTYMPPSGSALRAEQSSAMARLFHDWVSEPWIKDSLEFLEQNLHKNDHNSKISANVREWKRLVKRASQVPPALVEEFASASVFAQQAWVEARAKNDFPSFLPWLEKILRLKREESRCYSGGDPSYDSLLEEYEPGCTTDFLDKLFASLKPELTRIAKELELSCPQVKQHQAVEYPLEAQKKFSEWTAAQCGFDFSAGRLDTTAHPFCCGIGPGDCRITTRFNPGNFFMGFFGVLHETGHGLYEQGLPSEDFGLPTGSACSLGIHESQSRLWENQVGRSSWFWEWCYPWARKFFPAQLKDTSLTNYLREINRVVPGLIRVDADEVTYNQHIILRYELEKMLIEGNLSPVDLPYAWNVKMLESLGLQSDTDSSGCLQDIHWSAGLIGYFPTYLLGNLYSAQIYQKASTVLGLEKTPCSPEALLQLRDWLKRNIHSLGKLYSADELCEKATGTGLSPGVFVQYLKRKYQNGN
ncbi:MAG: carboxypeptidase M32 [Gemmataceae bacterium]|nr:carboxypeptidase M32 [Gemmataceae bacterium]